MCTNVVCFWSHLAQVVNSVGWNETSSHPVNGVCVTGGVWIVGQHGLASLINMRRPETVCLLLPLLSSFRVETASMTELLKSVCFGDEISAIGLVRTWRYGMRVSQESHRLPWACEVRCGKWTSQTVPLSANLISSLNLPGRWKPPWAVLLLPLRLRT